MRGNRLPRMFLLMFVLLELIKSRRRSVEIILNFCIVFFIAHQSLASGVVSSNDVTLNVLK